MTSSTERSKQQQNSNNNAVDRKKMREREIMHGRPVAKMCEENEGCIAIGASQQDIIQRTGENDMVA